MFNCLICHTPYPACLLRTYLEYFNFSHPPPLDLFFFLFIDKRLPAIRSPPLCLRAPSSTPTMKFPTLSRQKPASNVNGAPLPSAGLRSSQNTSSTEVEKGTPIVPSPSPSTRNKNASGLGETDVIETTPMKEMEALDKLSDEPEYPTGAKLGIIIASLCLSVFLMALDNTIIATAIPKITDQFKALNDVGWFVTSPFSSLNSDPVLSLKAYLEMFQSSV